MTEIRHPAGPAQGNEPIQLGHESVEPAEPHETETRPEKEDTPMLDVHAPHGGVHTWKDFWIHLGTIAAGLLIAISLEQGVEALHHLQQRHQLQEDLQDEAEANRKLILRDLTLARQEAWFEAAMKQVAEAPRGDKVIVSLPSAPCVPGVAVMTGPTRYVAPSQAVWTTAKDSGLVALLPAKEGRAYANLVHNYDLLTVGRNNTATACDKVSAMERRFAVRGADGATETWTMDPRQAQEFAAAAADAQTAIRGLVFRLRFMLTYEEAILAGDDMDQMLANANQLKEDDPLPDEKP